MNGVSRVVSSILIPITILVVVGISLLIIQKRAKAVGAKDIESHFPDPSTIWRTEPSANFIGLKSRGGFQIRGNGVLVLTAEELWFSRFALQLVISIPLNQIQEVCLVKSHLGKRVFGSQLLYVEFQTSEGVDAVAWFVAQPQEWQSAILGLVIATEKFWSVRLKSLKLKAFLGILIDKSTIASTCSTVPI